MQLQNHCRVPLVGIVVLLLCLSAGCLTNSDHSKPKDTDKDGHPDKTDDFPNDPLEWKDSDNDTYGDNRDKFDTDPTEWNDSDDDGHGDSSDRFPNDHNEWNDSDNDTYGDNGDKFPSDPKEWADEDGDGYGDNCDKFPKNPTDWNDTDNDGVGDNLDRFPNDPTEWDDTDFDGVGDNHDDFPNDSSGSANLSLTDSGSYHIGPTYYVYGIILNNKTMTVGGSRDGGWNISVLSFINGTFYKEEVFSGFWSVNFSLGPGEILPFYVEINDQYQRANSFKVVHKAGYFNVTPHKYLIARNITGSYDPSNGRYTMNGTMWNNMSFTVSNIHYWAAFFDSKGAVIDVRSGENQGAFLWPQNSAVISAFSPSPAASTIVSTKVCFVYK